MPNDFYDAQFYEAPHVSEYRSSERQSKAYAEERLATAKRLLDLAKEDYEHSIMECIENKISNVKMASILGVTEAAVRMYRKRHGLNRES